MRSLLVIGFIGVAAVTSAFGGADAFAAPVSEIAPMSNVELAAASQMAAPRADGRLAYSFDARYANLVFGADKGEEAKGFAGALSNFAVVASAGLLAALAAVGVRWVWAQSPIRDPYQSDPNQEGPA